MHETKPSSHSLVIAFTLAVLCHGLALIFLDPLERHSQMEQRLPLSVTLSSDAASASSKITAPEEFTPVSPQDEPPLVFRRPDSLPGHPNHLPVPAADTSWVGSLFSSKSPSPPSREEAPLSETTQINTRELPILSPYHAQLIQILARNQYHDKQYAFASLKRTRKVLLNLKLHPSGALLRVSVDQSSGDLELDAAAQRSAYAASPFPPPPASDARLNYIYPIEIQYQPGRSR